MLKSLRKMLKTSGEMLTFCFNKAKIKRSLILDIHNQTSTMNKQKMISRSITRYFLFICAKLLAAICNVK